MLQSRHFGSRRLCAYLALTRPCGLNAVMTVNTVSPDPRLDARQPRQQQTFSTTSPAEASGNSYYQPRGKGGDTPPSSEAEATSHQQSRPKNTNSATYVLTLLTDPKHHEFMTALRRHYFPSKLYKVEAHLTLFHALAGDLEGDIIPEIERIVSRTKPYRLAATNPARLRQGFSVNVADDIDYANKGKGHNQGRNMSRIIHAELRKKWSDWLSEQDSKPLRIHYTIMNKVDDEAKCNEAMAEVEEMFTKGSIPKDLFQAKHAGKIDFHQDAQVPVQRTGEVLGLTLWRYERGGHWVEPRHFEFPTE